MGSWQPTVDEVIQGAIRLAKRVRRSVAYRLRKARHTWLGALTLWSIYLDRKYGGSLSDTVPTRHADLGATDTNSSQYFDLRRLFAPETGVRIKPNDVLVDIGCGKGRVINYWLSRGLGNRIVGVELDEQIARSTAARLASHRNVQVVAGNAIEVLPEDGTIFFLFNPFNASVMSQFMDKVYRLAIGKATTVWIVCHNCGSELEGDPRWVVQEVRGTLLPSYLIRLGRGSSSSAAGEPVRDHEALRAQPAG